MPNRPAQMTRAVGASVCLALLVPAITLVAQQTEPSAPVMRPVISEDVSPLESIAPVAADGHRGEGLLRKPPGDGPFPAVLLIHGGLRTRPTERIREYALGAHPSRFLEAGYVVAVITYRSRDVDPQSTVSLTDSVAAVDYLEGLPYVDPSSVVVYGCSGGGDLALEVAAATEVTAIAPEEPASMIMAGVFKEEQAAAFLARVPRSEEFYVQLVRTASDIQMLVEKIPRMSRPILILQGDGPTALNRFNAEVLLPQFRAAGKTPQVITYPGEPHCFAFNSRTPAALKAFQDTDTFFRKHIHMQPTPLDSALVEHVAVEFD